MRIRKKSTLVFTTCLLSLLVVVVVGCGVKSKPLAPLTAPPIGRGKPKLSKKYEKVSLDELQRGEKSDEGEFGDNENKLEQSE